jgi:hypothetical protein
MQTLTATHDNWTATYSGGPYIALHRWGRCVESIYIADRKTGEYRMEPTLQGLTAELEKWVEANADNVAYYKARLRFFM